MIKSELVQRIATQNPHLYQRDIENIINAILDEIVGALGRGDRVELRGFGAFSVKNRPARTGRNPRTGAHVAVEEKHVPFFKTGKEMRERLNRPKRSWSFGRVRREPDPVREIVAGSEPAPCSARMTRHGSRRRPMRKFFKTAIARFCSARSSWSLRWPIGRSSCSRSTRSDRYDPTDPLVFAMPLFVLAIALVMIGVLIGGIATWFRQGKWRRLARQRGG